MTSTYNLSRITSREELIRFLGISNAKLDAVLAFQPPTQPQLTKFKGIAEWSIPTFLRHRIPKKNRARGYRIVWEPLLLKSTYKGLARKLDVFFRHHLPSFPHNNAYGYRPGRNIRENAKVHTGNALVLSLDIADFFPSISKKRIEALFVSLGMNELVSDLLSRFVTIDGSLAPGLPTSPVLSNAIALPIDIDLAQLADRAGAVYSRYADDITFSGDVVLPNLSNIEECLRKHHFQVAQGKTRWSKRGQAHYVTGLSVSDPAQPHVPRQRKRLLRQHLYYMQKFGVDQHFQRCGISDWDGIQRAVNSIDGMIKFIAHHEPRMAPSLKSEWNEILRTNGMRASFSPKQQNRSPFFIFIDEAEFERAGTKMLALGMSASQHEDRIFHETNEVLISTIGDIWSAGDIAALQKKGLHFADASEDLCKDYVTRLAAMPFEGYVAFQSYGSPNDYEGTYLRLLRAMIARRLMAAESQLAALYFEKNSKVSAAAIEACVRDAYDELKRTNNRRPKQYTVDFVSKPNHGNSVPDFLLGILGRYLRSKPALEGKPEPRARLMFDRLRDKYRFILDLSTGIEYSRRRPIEPWE